MFWILVDNKHKYPLVNEDRTVTKYVFKRQVPKLKGYHPERIKKVSWMEVENGKEILIVQLC